MRQLEKPVARITYVNSRLGPEPHQISSGDSKVCTQSAGRNLFIARFWGLRDRLKGQWSSDEIRFENFGFEPGE